MNGMKDSVGAKGRFIAICTDSNGNEKWKAFQPNLVMNDGLSYMNSVAFDETISKPKWFIGLFGSEKNNTPDATDTAQSHPGWVELTNYVGDTRPEAVFANASKENPSVISNAKSSAKFVANEEVVVGGAFLINSAQKGSSSGVLFSAAYFASIGDRTLFAGDILNVVYEFYLGRV